MLESFTSEYKVTIGDINYGGHLGNEKALVIFQEARLNFLKTMGFNEIDIGENLGIIMVESGVRYLQEIFHGDKLNVEIFVAEIKGKKFSLNYRITRKSCGELVLTGFTAFLIFDYGRRKVVKMPGQFRQKLNRYFED